MLVCGRCYLSTQLNVMIDDKHTDKHTNVTAPLKGLRIIAVEQYGAGPFGTAFLVNMGAEVIKVENPQSGGDVSRNLGPYFVGGDTPSNDSLFYQGLNTGKKSFALDLTKPAARDVFADLAGSADALVTNLRGDVPEKLGLTYAQLCHRNKMLVCAHLTAYGRDNERADWPGYDYMMQAEAGYFHLTGDPKDSPARFGLSVIDFMAGVTLAFALSAALLGARSSGIGRDIDVSLFDVALYNLNYVAMWQLNAGFTQARIPRSAHFSLTPCQLYKTQDGWIYLMCNKEKFWHVLCEKIGRPEWREEERFCDFTARLKHRDLLTELLDDALKTKTTGQWLDFFDGQVPAAPVLDVQQALTNPFLQSNNNICTVQHDADKTFQALRNPVRYASQPATQITAPQLGADTDNLLSQLGYNKETIDHLKQQGVI